MSSRLVLAINDEALAAEAAALLREGGDVEILDVVANLDDVVGGLHHSLPDVLVLHDKRGMTTALQLTLEVSQTFGEVAVVLILHERDLTTEHLHAAMQAGARNVAALPFTLEGLLLRVRAAADWGRVMRERVAAEPEAAIATGLTGRMTAIAAAKGGCGATTLAIHLALAVIKHAPGVSVCLVDLDLQTGDFRSFLDLPYRRSITDLVKLSGELSVRHLDETLYVHRSGVRVLLAPEEGEYAEDAVTDQVATAVLGALRARHDLTIVDVGTAISHAAVTACELADQALVVTTPDVLALRGAQRLMRLWGRVRATGPAPKVVLNRTSRKREVQPDLARRVVGDALCSATIPADFAALEPVINTGLPERLDERKLGDAFVELADELGLLLDVRDASQVEQPAATETRSVLARLTGERGQSTVETMGILPVIGIIVLMLWQFGLIGYAYMISNHAAREAARANAVGEPAVARIREDIPKAWRDGLRCAISDTRVRVSVAVPALFPGLDTPLRISSQAGTPSETQAVGEIDRNLAEPVKREDNPCRPEDERKDEKQRRSQQADAAQAQTRSGAL